MLTEAVRVAISMAAVNKSVFQHKKVIAVHAGTDSKWFTEQNVSFPRVSCSVLLILERCSCVSVSYYY